MIWAQGGAGLALVKSAGNHEVAMKSTKDWVWFCAWVVVALFELYIGINATGTKGLVSLAIAAVILVWQGRRLQQHLQGRK